MRYIKRYAKALYMSLAMFSAVPLPSYRRDESCLSLMLPCLPLIGLLLGAAWWGTAKLLILSGIHPTLAAGALAVTPFLLSGFLHLDGFIDTSDAVLSRRPLEDKLRILKDPHAGAFSVIALAVLFVLQFAAVYAIIDGEKELPAFLFITVISRCCASLSLLSLKTMPQSTYARSFKQNTRFTHRFFVFIIAILTMVAAYMCTGLGGLAVGAFTVLGFAGAMTYAYIQFKGVSGDLAGYAMVIGELCGLIALAVI